MTEEKANQYIAKRIIHDLKALDASTSCYGLSAAEEQEFYDELLGYIAIHAERCPENTCWTIS